MDDVCVILGGGGHAQVLIDCIQMIGRIKLLGILEHDRTRWGQKLLNIPILGGDDLLADIIGRGVNCFVVGVGGTGNNLPRQRLYDLGLANQLKPMTIVHPAAVCSRWAKVGAGSQLLPGSIINAGAVIGVNVIVNSGATVEHDCIVGNHVHIATGAILASTVRIGDGAHIGAGATVKQCLTIGEGSLVGAGAVVVKDVAAHMVVAGVPARPLRPKNLSGGSPG
jgi:sugar O-acyltransferase (sialic acid O-acetyltransferase NeuD family)